MNHRKRRVPKKIRLLLILNAFLLSCIFILGFLLLKRAASTPVTDKQETNTSQTVNQQGSTKNSNSHVPRCSHDGSL